MRIVPLSQNTSLYRFLLDEARFRLTETLDVPEEKITDEIVEDYAGRMFEDDFIFDYDHMDEIGCGLCKEYNLWVDEI